MHKPSPPPGKSLLIDPMACVRLVQPRTTLQSTIAPIDTRKAKEASTKLFVSCPFISKLTSGKMDSLQLPPGLPSPVDGVLASPILALVFLLSALLVFLYVILVWFLIMRALVGRWWGEKEEKDMEAQRIFVWALQSNRWRRKNQENQFEIISWITLHMKRHKTLQRTFYICCCIWADNSFQIHQDELQYFPQMAGSIEAHLYSLVMILSANIRQLKFWTQMYLPYKRYKTILELVKK